MPDQIELTIREVPDQVSDAAVQVTSACVYETDAVHVEELIEFLHKHQVYEYYVRESRQITNWGASAEFQNIVVTLGSGIASGVTAAVVAAIIDWLRSRAPQQTIHGNTVSAEAFLKQHFGPLGALVCDEVRRVEGGTQMSFHDEASTYEVLVALDGNFTQATRRPGDQGKTARA